MNTAVTILIILFAMMLVLMLKLLRNREPQPAPAAIMPISAHEGVNASQPETAPDEKEELLFPEDPDFAETDTDDQSETELLNTETPEQYEDDDPDDDFLFDQDILDQMLNEQEPEFALPYEPLQEGEPVFAEPLTADSEEKEPVFIDDDTLLHKPADEEEDQDTQVALLRQGVRIAWPDSDVMMSSAAFKGCVLYNWQGLSNGNDTVLFDVHEKDLGYPLLEAARRISDQNLKPANRFAILIHTDDLDEAYCRQSATAYLRSSRQAPSLVLSDYAQQYEESGILSEYEMISVGTRPHMILAAEGAEDTVKQIADLSLKHVRINDVNETAFEAYERMKKHLPLSARTGLGLGINTNSAVRKAAEKIPQSAGWIRPGFTTASANGTVYVTLYAPDDACLESVVDEFRENMRRNNLTFRVLKHVHETVPASVDDDAFILLEKAYAAAGFTKTLIPVLSEEDFTIRGIRTLSIPSKRMDRRKLDQLLMKILLGE